MPYQPAARDPYFIPNWNAVHPDRHPRFISMKADKLRAHQMDFGTGGYVPYGTDMTADELKENVTKLGLNESYINTNLNRIVVGDTMLAYIPRDEFNRRQSERIALNSDKEQAEVDNYLASQTHKGVRPVVFASEEDFQDRKKFNTRESNNRVGYSGPTRVA